MELGGPSKDRKFQVSNGYDDNSMTNISLSLSNSSPSIQEESKLPSSPESSSHTIYPNHMRNEDLEIPAVTDSSPIPSRSYSPSSINSVVTAEGNRENHQKSSGGELADHDTSSSMVLAGCPRCLMYVMLWKHNPRCPKCNTSTLLNFFHGQ